uniref:U6 snRNA-associated Sm-like protein LSm4 n=1 Tax=Equus asinus TaxID=9793 RepID=A0A9L0I410_EQUAS
MLPLSLLKTAQNHPMLVELKNGETYNGHLVSCDNWMNINLREVICTSRVCLAAGAAVASQAQAGVSPRRSRAARQASSEPSPSPRRPSAATFTAAPGLCCHAQATALLCLQLTSLWRTTQRREEGGRRQGLVPPPPPRPVHFVTLPFT